MKTTNFILAFFAAALVWMIGCQPIDSEVNRFEGQLSLPTVPLDYATQDDLPQHLANTFINTFNNQPFFDSFEFNGGLGIFDINNSDIFFDMSSGAFLPQITDEGATLGRVLFYDPQLSLNNAVSCGSCHHQDKAFADGQQFSKGFGGKITPRNSMSIVNVGLNNNLFWDSRLASLQVMVTHPIQNHIEMGMESMEDIEVKLAKVDYYPALFEKAFGTQEITTERVSNAMTQFLSAMKTGKSKFDQGFENNFTNYTPLELEGKDLFMSTKTNCTSCHAGINFAAPDFPGGPYGQPSVKGTANIGLDLDYADEGKGEGKFRIPSLRNIALTGPYMHDGRFETLEEVVEHYNSGVQAHHALDHNLVDENGQPQRLNLSTFEKKALVAFLHTLTDDAFITDERYSNPFQ